MHKTSPFPTLLFTLIAALMLSACGMGDDEVAEPDDTAAAADEPVPERNREPAQRRMAPREDPLAGRAPMPQPGPCAALPLGEAARILGGALTINELPSNRRSTNAAPVDTSCEFTLLGVEPGDAPALRLDVVSMAGLAQRNQSPDEFWAEQTTAANGAKSIGAPGDAAYWVSRRPPVKRAVLVRGVDRFYELTSLYYGARSLTPEQLEDLAVLVAQNG